MSSAGLLEVWGCWDSGNVPLVGDINYRLIEPNSMDKNNMELLHEEEKHS